MKKIIVVLTAVSVVLAGCAGMNRQQKGAIGGAAAGAAAGALVSDSVWGVLAGAAIGGLAGGAIGKSMDKQAKELEQAVPTAEVQRVGEGINMTFASGLMFPLNSATLSDSYKDDLAASAAVFGKYADTNIVIEGHTDDTGSAEYNMDLSNRRAQAVANFLQAQGITASRVQTKGYGETTPKYPNDSDANRAQNRRVELAVFANEEMKADAKAGTL